MPKADLIEKIAEDAHIDKTTAKKVADHFFEEIAQALSRGEPIHLQNFGTFEVRRRAARVGRNLRSGELIRIPAAKAPAFRAAAQLKKKC